MTKSKWARRTVLFGLLSGAAERAFGTVQQRAARQQRPPFAGRLRQMFINADNTGFEAVSHSFEDSDMCVVSAEATEGPYYVDDPVLTRPDIREDRDGIPLEVALRVVSADGCEPIAGAAVDVWHCDSLGFYSHYTGNDPSVWPKGPGTAQPTDEETFLRGRQRTDDDGMVRFRTIYPGWYTPRTHHIHARVLVGDQAAATIQLYFPEKLNREISLQPPYDQRPPSPYNNMNDIVIGQSKGGNGSWLKMTKQDEGYLGTLTIGIRS